MYRVLSSSFVSILFTVVLLGCTTGQESAQQAVEAELADTVLFNGSIYTLDAEQPWVEAVAIKEGRFLYVGSNEKARSYIGAQGKAIDLKGQMAMPGLIDAHVHPVLAGTEKMFQCNFPPTSTPEEVKGAIESCIEQNPIAEWVVGGRWDSDFFSKYNIRSPRLWLDSVSKGKAVVLQDDTGHNRWVNSRVLEHVGFDKDSKVPGGEIVKDKVTGELNGLLFESAMIPVLEAIPTDRSPEEIQNATKLILDSATAYGITGLKEAGDSNLGLSVYRALERTGKLHHHIAFAIFQPLRESDLSLDEALVSSLISTNSTPHINPAFVKLFLDGVPAAPRTAAMLENYIPEKEDGHAHNGKLLLSPSKLTALMTRLDALGITVNVHAAGDRAARVVLDAIEQVRKVNGRSGLRHEVAHAGFLHPDDILRFRQLNAVADLSPAIWFPSPIIDSIGSAVGDRGKRYFPINSLIESGAQVSAGSDLPAVLPNINPWNGIEAMVTRKDPDGVYPGSLWPEEAISLEQALKIYTLSGAQVLKKSSTIGSIEVGKSADLVVLNQNVFSINVDDIGSTKAEMTFFEGEMVYQK